MPELIVNKDGSLFVPPASATWQVFLQLSRGLNSREGGWNSRTYWVEKGLSIFASDGKTADLISAWTSNSLEAGASPEPRSRDFQLDLRENKAKSCIRGSVDAPQPNRLGIMKMPQKPEDRLNWWLYMSLRSAGRKMTYELPLCETADNLLRADLVHFFPQHQMVEIVELKKGPDAGRDSPLMALTECICYGLQLIRCWTSLKPEVKEDLGVAEYDLKRIHLILAAPEFCQHCSGDGRHLTDDQMNQLTAIVIAANATFQDLGLEVRFFLSFADVVNAEDDGFPKEIRAVRNEAFYADIAENSVLVPRASRRLVCV